MSHTANLKSFVHQLSGGRRRRVREVNLRLRRKKELCTDEQPLDRCLWQWPCCTCCTTNSPSGRPKLRPSSCSTYSSDSSTNRIQPACLAKTSWTTWRPEHRPARRSPREAVAMVAFKRRTSRLATRALETRRTMARRANLESGARLARAFGAFEASISIMA